MPHAKKPLFPTKIGEAIVDLDAKRKYLKTNAGRFGIASADLSRMDAAVNAAQTAYTAASDPDTRTQLDKANRDLAMETAQDIERKIINWYVAGSSAITPVDYEMLRIPLPGPHPHLPDPVHVPGIRSLISRELAIIAHFFDILTGHEGKPEGVQSIEAYMKIGGDPPASPAEMTERKIGTDSPLRIQFEYEQEFLIVYIAFRWVGTRGVYGPWSEIHKIAIAR